MSGPAILELVSTVRGSGIIDLPCFQVTSWACPPRLEKISWRSLKVLFMDIGGYAKRLINQQRALLDRVDQVVRSRDEFRNAEAVGRLIKISTGDPVWNPCFQQLLAGPELFSPNK